MPEKTYHPLLISSILAATNIKQNRFIGFDGNYCQDKAKAYGVSDVDAENREIMPVNLIGVLLIESGGEIPVGSEVTSDSEGKAVALSENAKGNGYALDQAYAAGEVIRIIRGI